MLEAYSQNVTVLTNTAIPFNSTSIQKGCTAVKSGSTTIQLNKCGVYMVEVDGSATATADGNVSIQLRKNGTLQPQAISTATGTTTTVVPVGFTTLVQVSENNSCRCYDSPTVLTIDNVGVGATFNQVNVVVTKIC